MKLSKFELDIVANRATDILEEKHLEANKEILESNDYKNFESVYTDETADKLRVYTKELDSIEDKISQLNKLAQEQRDKINNLYKEATNTTGYFYGYAGDRLTSYLALKKKELYPDAEFNRSKVFNKMSTDILLSSLKTPAEFLDSISN